MRYGFKAFRITKSTDSQIELQDELNAFLKENENLVPRSVSVAAHGSYWFTAVVLYEYEGSSYEQETSR